MHARPVVGGFFIKMLTDRADVAQVGLARQARARPTGPRCPPPPKITMLVPGEQTWRYTTAKPGDGWTQPGFDAAAWKEGRAGFGTPYRGFLLHTPWKTDDIWLRGELTVPPAEHPHLQFIAFHDEDVEIYVNGILAATEGGFTTKYVPLEISAEARAVMKPGAKSSSPFIVIRPRAGRASTSGWAT